MIINKFIASHKTQATRSNLVDNILLSGRRFHVMEKRSRKQRERKREEEESESE